MEIPMFKKMRDALIENDIPFIIVTDENYSYHHFYDGSGRIFFDDANNIFFCIDYTEPGIAKVTMSEYERILMIEFAFDKKYNESKDFISSKLDDITGAKIKEEMLEFIDMKYGKNKEK